MHPFIEAGFWKNVKEQHAVFKYFFLDFGLLKMTKCWN